MDYPHKDWYCTPLHNILIHCFVTYTVTGTVERIIAVFKTYNEFKHILYIMFLCILCSNVNDENTVHYMYYAVSVLWIPVFPVTT